MAALIHQGLLDLVSTTVGCGFSLDYLSFGFIFLV